MRLERLLNIVIILINHRQVKAKDLADRFEVSIRTIYRDIEALGLAGIPVVTHQGGNGGIGLAEGYRLDRHLLTDRECASIVTALRSIGSLSAVTDTDNHMLMEKIRSIIPAVRQRDFQQQSSRLLVDFSPWGTHPELDAMLAAIRQAIDSQRLLQFHYCNAEGEFSRRLVEPYHLMLKGRGWYVHAYCRARADYRLFKLQRMKEVKVSEQDFPRRADAEIRNPAHTAEQWHRPDNTITLVLRFREEVRHLAEEWFGAAALESVEPQDGMGRTWQTAATLPENRWLYGFILSFGPDVEVLEPPHIRRLIRSSAQQIAKIYAND